MYFSLTQDQVNIQKAAREFSEGEFRDIARELDRKEAFDDRLWKKAADLGFLGVFIEEKYEGMGMGYLDQCLIVEEFARVDLGIAHAIESTFFGTQLIQMVGSEAQKNEYLPPICNGKIRMGMAITEPDAGSDVSSVSTTAVLDNDEWVINGSKIFITNCNLADFLVVLCVTNPEHPKVHHRFSTIIVETEAGQQRLGSCGRAALHFEVRVVDELDRQVPQGEVGELTVRGEAMTVGYWDLPEETSRLLKGGWLHTGDFARQDKDGFVYIVDRKNDMVISGGKNIYPREVDGTDQTENVARMRLADVCKYYTHTRQMAVWDKFEPEMGKIWMDKIKAFIATVEKK